MYLQGGEEGLGIEFNHVPASQSFVPVWWNPNKNFNHWSWSEIFGKWTHLCVRRVIFWFHRKRTWQCCIQDCLGPCPMCFLFWLVLIRILYHKTVITSIELSWILWVISANYQSWGGHKNSRICRQLVKSRGGLRTLKFAAGVWGGAALLGTLPLICGVYVNSGWLVWEISCDTVLCQLLEHVTHEYWVDGLHGFLTYATLKRWFRKGNFF